ncbi:MAG: helix-turn-helix domain-containing protein [Peptoniphilaceae bacterium]|jgi:putative transcriptional regulator
MIVNYSKLWKLLIDRDMKKTELIRLSGISTNAMANMGKGKNVSTSVLCKICKALNCGIEDIIEVEKENELTLR